MPGLEELVEMIARDEKGMVPVSSADVASVVCRDATAVDYDSEQYEARASDDLHYTKRKLHLLPLAPISSKDVNPQCVYLAITFHTKKLNGKQSHKHRHDPSCVVDAI